MPTVMQKAAKSQRKALKYLYENNCRKIFYTAKHLLNDNSKAAEITFLVFKTLFENISKLDLVTEENFTVLAIKKTAEYCKKKILKENSKAFRIPLNKNFVLQGDYSFEREFEQTEEAVISQFSDVGRFLFVLHTVGELSKTQLSEILKFDIKTVDIALNDEKVNVTRILKALGKSDELSYEKLVENFKENEKLTNIDSRTDEQIFEVINNVALPFEKSIRLKALFISAVTILFCGSIGAGVFIAATRTANTTSGDVSSDTAEADTTSTHTPEALQTDLTYYADIEIRDHGTVTVKLDQSAAPITCANFVNLAESGFYDGLTFHRIIEGFMMQGGDPNGDGTGGSENNIVGEFSANGYENDLSHTAGAISMARSDDYDSASSQFFIVHKDSSESLDGLYAVFGYVTEGMDIVNEICSSAEPSDDNGTIPAEEQPIISTVTIRTE